MTTTAAPAVPALPAHLRAERALLNAADRAALPAGYAAGLHYVMEALTIRMARTPAQLAEEAAYDREVARYNVWVAEQNAAIRARREARLAHAETAAVRASACSSCFTVHAGECL